MMELSKYFNERIFVSQEISKVREETKLSPDELLEVVQVLIKLDRLQVMHVLAGEASTWLN